MLNHIVTGRVQSLQLVYSVPVKQESLKLDVRLISSFPFIGNGFQLQSSPEFCSVLTHSVLPLFMF